MFLNQIEAFVNVVKYKSFSAAAKELYLSQPTISSHIKSLENELGVQLIVRSTKDVVLSDAGKIFYEYALELLHIRDTAYQRIHDYTTDISGTLPIAASTVPAQYVLPQILVEIVKLYPKIIVKILQMENPEVIHAVENFEVEFGIVGTNSSNSKCSFEPLMKDHLVLITPNTEEYRQLEGSFPTELFRKVPFVWLGKENGPCREASAYFESIGMTLDDLNIAAEMPNTESIKHAVHYGLGVSIISRKAAEDYEKLGYLLSFDLDSEFLDRSLYLVCHKNRMISPVASHFIEQLRSICGNSAI